MKTARGVEILGARNTVGERTQKWAAQGGSLPAVVVLGVSLQVLAHPGSPVALETLPRSLQLQEQAKSGFSSV